MNASRESSMAWLGHPVTLLALVTLIVNDHFLKTFHPSWVTGKLSDAAGLVLAPPLIVVVTRLRPRWAIAVAGVGFTLVKTLPYAAGLASAAWTAVSGASLVRVDPTDLLALPFLALAGLARRSTRGRPATPNWVRALRLGVLLPIALLGVAADSASPYSTSDQVVVSDGGIYLFAHNQRRTHAALSIDSGRTWITLSDQPGWTQAARGLAIAENPAADDQACSAREARICFRVVPGALAVQASTDGGVTWTDSWRVSAHDAAVLGRKYSETGFSAPPPEGVSLAIQDVPDGHVVVVATGRDGFAERSADGTWRRIGFPAMPDLEGTDTPSTLGDEDEIGPFTMLLCVVVNGVVLAAIIFAIVRARRRAP